MRNWVDMGELVRERGCPIGRLCAELGKNEDRPDLGAGVFDVLVDWAEAQFRQLGRRDAPDLALVLFAGIQGAALLSNSLCATRAS